jgi:hypothetical protein
LRIGLRGVCPAELLGSIPAVGSSSPWSGCQDACLLSIASLCPLLGVHPTRPAVRGPGVQSSGVQPVQCLGIWLPRPDAAVRPAGVQPVRRPARPASSRLEAVRPPGRSRLVPCPPDGGDGRDLGAAGSGQDWIESSSRWSGPVPAARSTARGAWMRAPLRSRVQAGGGASAADLGWVVLRREAPPDRAGRTAAGGACRWRRRSGRGWLARCCRTAPCGAAIWAWSHDYAAWSWRSLTSEWTGPEGPNELGGQDGARPQRGPAR